MINISIIFIYLYINYIFIYLTAGVSLGSDSYEINLEARKDNQDTKTHVLISYIGIVAR